MKALRTVAALEEGKHVTAALDTLLYERVEGADPLDFAAPCTPESRRVIELGVGQIFAPGFKSIQHFLNDIPCFHPVFSDRPHLQMWKK